MEISLLLLLSFLRAPLLSSEGKNSSWESRLTQVCLSIHRSGVVLKGERRKQESAGTTWLQKILKVGVGGEVTLAPAIPGFLGFILPCKELSNSHRSAEVR